MIRARVNLDSHGHWQDALTTVDGRCICRLIEDNFLDGDIVTIAKEQPVPSHSKEPRRRKVLVRK